MAWYDRFVDRLASGFRNLFTSSRRQRPRYRPPPRRQRGGRGRPSGGGLFGGRQPPPDQGLGSLFPEAPRPTPEPTPPAWEPLYEPGPPAETVYSAVPPSEGFTYEDQEEFPGFFDQGFEPEVDIYDLDGNYIDTRTKSDWMALLTMNGPELRGTIGYSHHEIITAMAGAGIFNDNELSLDWWEFRQNYEAAHPGASHVAA